MLRALLLFAILMGFWLLMSGHYTLLTTGLGVASAVFATWAAVKIRATDSEGLPLHIFARLPVYLVWLVREIIVSNVATIKIILNGKPRPEVFYTPYSQKTPAGVATYANSITLTPGTVTLAIDDHGFIVHALDADFANDVRAGDMDRKVMELEGGQGA